MSEHGDTRTPADEQHEKHGLLDAAKETVAKAVGITVEVGSMLSGQAGEIVSAERAVAEAEAEELLDRVDEDEG